MRDLLSARPESEVRRLTTDGPPVLLALDWLLILSISSRISRSAVSTHDPADQFVGHAREHAADDVLDGGLGDGRRARRRGVGGGLLGGKQRRKRRRQRDLPATAAPPASAGGGAAAAVRHGGGAGATAVRRGRTAVAARPAAALRRSRRPSGLAGGYRAGAPRSAAARRHRGSVTGPRVSGFPRPSPAARRRRTRRVAGRSGLRRNRQLPASRRPRVVAPLARTR